MAKQTDDILTAAFVDKDGYFSIAYVSGTAGWNGPIRIGGPQLDPGTAVALTKQPDHILVAGMFDKSGTFLVAHVTDTDGWVPPHPV